MTLMTSLMSGTYMAMRRVTAIQMTVRTTLQRLSKDLVTTPLRFLWRRTTRFRTTDLVHARAQSQNTDAANGAPISDGVPHLPRRRIMG